MNSSLVELKAQVERLLSAVAVAAAHVGRDVAMLRGIAYYDPRKDSFVTSLDEFTLVASGLCQMQLVRERYGEEESQRIALQLVYEYFRRVTDVAIDPTIVASLWTDFVTELESPVWVTRCVSNLRHIQCDDLHVDLGDGISIYGRDPKTLADLGFDGGVIDRLFAQWGGFGASSFVLVAESISPKCSNNLIMVNDGQAQLRCARAIAAMRLLAPGDVGISTIYVQRVARFNTGVGGILSTGNTVDTFGGAYVWKPEYQERYQVVYDALAKLEKNGYSKGPGNLDLALRAFMSTFDRFPTSMETKLVDSITSLEAVLGEKTESSFKLAYRLASLLATTDAERASLLKKAKSYYDARSRIVHGDRLVKKHADSLAAVDDLRDLVRRLLFSFVQYAAADVQPYPKEYFSEELDVVLIDATSREKLRKVLGLWS